MCGGGGVNDVKGLEGGRDGQLGLQHQGPIPSNVRHLVAHQAGQKSRLTGGIVSITIEC